MDDESHVDGEQNPGVQHQDITNSDELPDNQNEADKNSESILSGEDTVPSTRPANSSHPERQLMRIPSIGASPSPQERETRLRRKLQQCCVIFDFTDPLSDLTGKEIKKQALLELNDYIRSALNNASNGGTKIVIIPESCYAEVFDMICRNLFRGLPPSSTLGALAEFDFDEDEEALEHAWPHLQLVYQFFLKFIETDFRPSEARRYVKELFVEVQLVWVHVYLFIFRTFPTKLQNTRTSLTHKGS